jgi:glycosyltransferase involved in cell wall biosynthesis
MINAVSAKLGGAATYIQNLARTLNEQAQAGDEFLFVVPPDRASDLSESARVRVAVSGAASASYAHRWWWDQVTFRRLVERERPDVLFSSANFGMVRPPCPQVLLVRNPIYFSREYLELVLPRLGARLRAETALRRWLVCRSAAAADCVMTPSAAMLSDLQRFVDLSHVRTVVNPYGVPRERVTGTPRTARSGEPLRILWVSHYADHKNLATLLRAAHSLREAASLPFQLQLTLDPVGRNGQHTRIPAEELRELQALGDAAQPVGVQSYEGAWRLYEAADLFVFPSLVESFGHPLVEAMAAGLPIVASDIAIHREICGDAAEYFPVLDHAALAGQMQRLLADPVARERLAAQGRGRVRQFLWEDHVARLLDVLRETAAAARGARRAA